MGKVLQKYIADSGLCSRRKAEILIKEGRVKLNKKVACLGDRVETNGIVEVDNRKLKVNNSKIYLKLNKPAGYVCSNRRFSGEKSIFDLVNMSVKLICAGRLDKASRGLVVLTNDGGWVNRITHPSFNNEKEYLVRVKNYEKDINNKNIIKQLITGVKDDGDMLTAKKVEVLSDNFYKVILTCGKKRHIRRMFKAIGLDVVDLIRVSIGNIKLASLKEGEWQYMKK